MAGVTGSIPVAPTIAHHNPLSEFFSLYSHDFVRVACCVPRTRVADAAYNLAETLRLAAEGDKARTAVMVFPELGLSSYAIDDLLLQDALLDEVEASIAKVVAASNKLFPVLIVGAPLRRRRPALQHRRRHPSRRASSASCPRPTCRTTASSTRSASSSRAPTSSSDTIRLAGHEAPFGTDLLFRSTGIVPRHLPCRDLRGHLGAGAAVEPRGARRRGAAGQPVGQQHHHRQGRGAAPAVRQPVGARHRGLCLFGVRARANRRPTSPGTATPRSTSCGDQLAETARFAKDSTIVTADVDLGRIRQERLRNNGFADCAHDRGRQGPALPHGRLRARRAARQAWRSSAPIERFPYVPADPAKLRDNCYEAYNIQVQGLAQRLQSSRTEQRVIGVSGGLDSTQALIVACRAMDQLGLPRKNILAYTLPGFATSDKTHKQRLAADEGAGRHRRPRSTSSRRRSRCWPTSAIPSPRARRSTTSPSRTCRRACAPTTCSASPTSSGGMVVGTGDLSELALGWCTYGVGDHMSHYNPNGSVSKTLIQHLIRFVAASGDVERGHGRDPARHPRHRDLARAGPGRRERRDPVDRELGRPLRAAGLQPVLPDAARLPAVEDRLPGLERLARRRQGRLAGQPAGRRRGGPTSWPRSSTG